MVSLGGENDPDLIIFRRLLAVGFVRRIESRAKRLAARPGAACGATPRRRDS